MIRKIKVSQLYQYYSHAGKDGHSDDTELWMVDVNDDTYVAEKEHGLKLNTIERAENVSRGWVGWGFQINDKPNNILFYPVLLLENKDDAMLVTLHCASNNH